MIPITKKTINPDEPKLPEIKIPNWLSPEIKSLIKEHLDFIKERQPMHHRTIYDAYAYYVRIFNKNKAIFTQENMIP